MSKDLNDLSLGIRLKANLLISKCRNVGLDVRILSTFRSIQEQDDLYAKGRTAPGSIVTNAKGGSSWHNFGLAFDIGVFVEDSYIGIPNDLLETAKYKWLLKDALEKEFALLYTRTGLLGEELKLQWGGRWVKFKDWGHFYEERLPASPKVVGT